MTLFPRWCVFTHGSVNSGFCSRLLRSFWESVQLGGCPLEFCLSLESGHMTFCPRRIVSTIDSFNYGFCPRVVLSTWKSVYLGGCLLEICLLGSLATWRSAHVGLFPLLVLWTLLSAHVWFCLLGRQTNWVAFYLNSIYLGSLATWHSAHVGLCQLLVRWTLDSTHVWIYLL